MILQRSMANSIFSSICRLSYAGPSSFLPLRPSSSSVICALCHNIRTLGTAATATVAAEDSNAKDTFFAAENVSWASLGVSNLVAGALSKIGLRRPSLVQATCIPSILSGAGTIVAAETGSGKTHGYLVPLIDMLRKASDDSEENAFNGDLGRRRHLSLILCPNVILCEQVVRMANCLLKEIGEPLLSVAVVCGRQEWPALLPDIIVSTPDPLLKHLHAVDAEKCRRSSFIHGMKYIVFDEADLLLCGSFQKQVIRIINMFHLDVKHLSRSKGLEHENPMTSNDSADMEFSGEDKEDRKIDAFSENKDTENVGFFEILDTQAPTVQNKDWSRVRKTYEKSKQYIFVAATLPVNGKATAGRVLKRLFPEASWVTGNYFHCHNPRLEQKWFEVTVSSQVDALISAVNSGINSSLGSSPPVTRTMIFANSVVAVEAVANILTGAEFECFRYHSDTPLHERSEILYDFQQKGGVFVCTDAAAHGLDIPNVSHVIQAEFPKSAVDFLHRVGCTARAGQPGLVTNMYTEANRDLVAAIREAEREDQPVVMLPWSYSHAEREDQPVENALNRNRSSRNITHDESQVLKSSPLGKGTVPKRSSRNKLGKRGTSTA